MRRSDDQKTAPKKENNPYTLNSSSPPLLYNIMQSLSAFQQCSLLPGHFNSDSFIQGDCGLDRMSIVSLVKTVLIVAAIMPWISVISATTLDRDLSVVRDIDGKPLEAGSQYYVLPVFRGRGGGLTLKRRNNTCPFYVAQDRFEVSRGLPVIFTPISGRQREIRVGIDLRVRTVALTICAQSNVWRIDFSKDPQRRLVATGGKPSTFRIERYGKDYALAFCVVVCPPCRPVCRSLGIQIDSHSDLWLASPGDVDFPVFFKKASAADSDSDSGSGFQSE